MPFRFPLQTLLRYRHGIEQQRELRLHEAAQRVAAVRREIEMVDHCAQRLEQGELRELASGLKASQLHFNRLCRSVLMSRRLELQELLAEEEKNRAHCQAEYQSAHRDREAVETLRKEGQGRYLREEARREQRRLDDLFLLRREYMRRR